MLSIGAMAKGQGGYYLDLAREDYYLEGGEPPGKWWGTGADEISLHDAVQKPDLQSLLKGFAPEGSPLIQNAGEQDHQPGWDLTFSPPKSVSVLWSQADEATRRTIQEAHHAAVTEALRYIEEEASFSRRGKAGKRRESAGLIVATFEHGTSRALDPQLHTHALVMNVATRPDGTTGTLLSKPIYRHKMAAGALYRSELAHRLVRDLGVTCRPEKTWFEIEAIPRPLIDEFSKRRAAIEKELADRGLESASAAAFATLSTREPKSVVPPRSELFARWKKVGEALGFSINQVLGTRQRETAATPRDFEAATKQALDTLTKHQSFFSETDFVRRVAEAGQLLNIPAAQARQLAREKIATSKDIVSLGELRGVKQYTTTQTIALEKKLIKQATTLGKGLLHGVPALVGRGVEKSYLQARSALLTEIKYHASQLIKAARKKPTHPIDRSKTLKDLKKTLTRDHVRAFRHLTRRGKGSIRTLDGVEGAEKSLLFRAVKEAYEKAGYCVLGVTQSKKAARELEKSTGMNTTTLSGLEFLMRHPLKHTAGHHANQLLRKIFGKQTLRRFAFDKSTVIILDDAATVGTERLTQLVNAAKKGRGLLILAGDTRNVPSIEAGGAFAYLTEKLGFSFLQRNVRQQKQEDRELVANIAEGKAQAALQDLAKRGLLTVAKDRASATQELVTSWSHADSKQREKSLILCGTAAEAHHISERCQEARLAAGELRTKASFALDGVSFFEGDRIVFQKTSKPLGVTNNDIGTITGINTLLRRVTARLDDGRRVVIPFRSYKSIALGYAVPSFAAASTTTDYAYVLVGGETQDRETTYLQLSRAKHETRVFADEKEAGPELTHLAEQIANSRLKTLAHTLLSREPEPQLGRTR